MRSFGLPSQGDLTERILRFIGGRWCKTSAFLVIVNAAIFVYTYGQMSASVASGEPIPGAAMFGLSFAGLLILQFWRLITFQFLQQDVVQLLLTSFALYLFGSYLYRRLGGVSFLLGYSVTGAIGGLAGSLVAQEWLLLGTSLSVAGLACLLLMYFPYLRFFGRVPAFYLYLVFMLLLWLELVLTGAPVWGSVAATIGAIGAAALFYHLREFLIGFVTKRRLKREIAIVFHDADRDMEMDRILQKVSREGLFALSKEERKFLSRASKEYKKH